MYTKFLLLLLFASFDAFSQGQSDLHITVGGNHSPDRDVRGGIHDGDRSSGGHNSAPAPPDPSLAVKEIVKSGVEKYTGLLIEGQKESEKAVEELVTHTKGLPGFSELKFGTIAGGVFRAINIAQTVQDLNEGRWGSAVCLGLDFIPGVGTAAGILCSINLTAYRIITSNHEQ